MRLRAASHSRKRRGSGEEEKRGDLLLLIYSPSMESLILNMLLDLWHVHDEEEPVPLDTLLLIQCLQSIIVFEMKISFRFCGLKSLKAGVDL